MDQRQTTEAQLYERAFPSRDVAYWLGQLLNYPTSDIPTVEDWEREQGLAGVPTEEQSARESGQDVLDWLTSAASLAGILRGSAAGRSQDLMSKTRGQETFGKEMMETSRRAQPQKWREMRSEEREHFSEPNASPYGAIRYGRTGRDVSHPEYRQPMPPEEPMGRRQMGARTGESRPADIVRPGLEEYRVGTPTALPGGAGAYYKVVPTVHGDYQVRLQYDTPDAVTGSFSRSFEVGRYSSVGEATAKARQLANRLALAAKDPELAYGAREDKLSGASRQIRMPWERGGLTDWRSDYYPPPTSGRWSGEQ